jgi:hypothetical protein
VRSFKFIACAFLLGCLTAPSAAVAQAPNGAYKCWFFTSPRSGLNFKLSGESYTDSQGKPGTVSISGGNMSFRGGGLDGIRAQYRGGKSAYG